MDSADDAKRGFKPSNYFIFLLLFQESFKHMLMTTFKFKYLEYQITAFTTA